MEPACSHFFPAGNWMNDPCGLVHHNGVYHLFYQYNPSGTRWGNIHWGHAISRDLCRWEDMGIALAPHPKFGHPFTGSVVPEPGTGRLVALLTAATPKPGGVWHQQQAVAVSSDGGFRWEWHPGPPVIPNPGVPDFRDPRVVRLEDEGLWMMALSAGDRVLFYRSQDLFSWESAGEFGAEYPEHRGVWECPDLIDFGPGQPPEERWLLLFSIGEGLPGGLGAVHYVFGSCDAGGFRPAAARGAAGDSVPKTPNGSLPVRTLDAGPDFYAFQSWTEDPRQLPMPPEDPVGIAWANNYAYAHTVVPRPGEANGVLTIPRRLSVLRTDDGPMVASRPAVAPGGVPGARVPSATPGAWGPPEAKALSWDVLTWYRWDEADGRAGGSGGGRPRELVFREGSWVLLTLEIDYGNRRVRIRREAPSWGPALEGYAFEKTAEGPPEGPRGTGDRFDLLVQRGLVELFAFDGGVTVTVRLYPEKPALSLTTLA
ncbi:MAG: glycoside hydrolase family 32 protein [Spirochaetota bacterium]